MLAMALNLDAALEQLFRGEILSEETVKEVCERLKESLIYQPNVLPIKAPVTVVGNVHGYAANGGLKRCNSKGIETPRLFSAQHPYYLPH